jgi:hypothetical protein
MGVMMVGFDSACYHLGRRLLDHGIIGHKLAFILLQTLALLASTINSSSKLCKHITRQEKKREKKRYNRLILISSC